MIRRIRSQFLPPDATLFVALATAWGLSFVAIEAGLASVPPLYFAGVRYALAGVLVLAYAGGLLSLGHALHGHAHAFGFSVAWSLPPGWGPTVTYAGSLVGFVVTPYKVLGYATLSYLVYVTVLETAGSAWAGAVGLFSCVSCTWPVLGTVLAGVFGSSAAVVVFASSRPYAASTLVFLSAVGLLLWRPFDRLAPGS